MKDDKRSIKVAKESYVHIELTGVDTKRCVIKGIKFIENEK
jgi:hypothetical protein